MVRATKARSGRSLRLRTLELYTSGHSIADVSRITRQQPSTVRRVLRRAGLLAKDETTLEERTGMDPTTNDGGTLLIKEIVRQNRAVAEGRTPELSDDAIYAAYVAALAGEEPPKDVQRAARLQQISNSTLKPNPSEMTTEALYVQYLGQLGEVDDA